MFSPFQAENSGEEEGRPVLPADGARSRPPVHPSTVAPSHRPPSTVHRRTVHRRTVHRPPVPRPPVRPTARAAPINGGQRESRSAFTSRPEDSQFASLDIQLIYFYTTNINISSSLTTFRATKSGNEIGQRQFPLGAVCGQGSDFAWCLVLAGDGPTIPSGAPCRWANDSERTAEVSPRTRGVYWQVSAIPQILSLIDVTHDCIIFILPIKNVIWFFASSAKEDHRPILCADVRRSTFTMGVTASPAFSAGLSASFRCPVPCGARSERLAMTESAATRTVK